MYSKKEKINTLGIVSGLMLMAIPFYVVFRFFASIGKVRAKQRALAIISVVLWIVGFIVLIYGLVDLIWVIGEEVFLYGDYNNYDYSSIDYDGMMLSIVAMLVGTLVLFIGFIFMIVTGLSTKKWLDSKESDYLAPAERYDVAKFAAIFLSSIPLYTIIKLILSINLQNSISINYSGGTIAVVILTVINSFGGNFSYIMLVNDNTTGPIAYTLILNLVSTALLIVSIVVGVQMKKSFECVVYEEMDENDLTPTNEMNDFYTTEY